MNRFIAADPEAPDGRTWQVMLAVGAADGPLYLIESRHRRLHAAQRALRRPPGCLRFARLTRLAAALLRRRRV